MALPRLVRAFADAGCFTLDEAVDALGQDRTSTRKEIDYLRRVGYVTLVRRGLYAMNPSKIPGGDQVDRFVIASKLAEPYMLGYHSALEAHGVAESGFFNEVYVCTEDWFNSIEFQRLTYRAVSATSELIGEGSTSVRRSGQEVQVASPELTILQCADRLAYAGGLSETVESLRGFPYVKWERLLDLLDQIGKTVLYRKVGFLATFFRDRWRTPEEILDQLEENVGQGSTYFGIGPNEGGTHVPRWQVIVPARYAEEVPRG